MSKPVSKMAEPSIDDMLSTIREAIHEETAREAEEHARTFKTREEPRKHEPEFRRADVPPPPTLPQSSPPSSPQPRATGVSGSMRELRVSLQPADQTHSRGTVTARSEDFLSLKNKLASLRRSPTEFASDANLTDTKLTDTKLTDTKLTDTSVADVMSGDVRLEDALARIDPSRETPRQSPPVAPRFVAPEPLRTARAVPVTNKPVVEPQMRAAINETPNDQAEIDYSYMVEVHAAPKPVAALTDPAPAPPEFVPPQITADPAVLAYTEVSSVSETPSQRTPVQSARVEPARVVEAPVEVVAPQPAPPPASIKQARVLQQNEAPVPVAVEAAPMMSGQTMLAASNAFELLSKEIFSKSGGGEQVLEDSARDMVRPMLKKWLDDNLPTLVERLVREEIERVARKGGR